MGMGHHNTKTAVVRVTGLLALLIAAALSVPAASAAEPLCDVPNPPPACHEEERERFDLTVDSIEVTQATQTPANGIPLVTRKGTAVRAEIGVAGPVPVFSVTGRLHVFVNGARITPAGGVPPIAALSTAWGSTDRSKQNDTLNFELPAPTAITASMDVDFQVDVSPKPGELIKSNNSGFANDLTAADRCTPWLYYTRINYTPSGLGAPPLARVGPGTGDAFVRGILPVNEADPSLYRETTSLTHSWDPNGDGRLSDNWGNDNGTLVHEQNKLLQVLEAQRQLIVQNYIGANDRTFLYGWVAGNPIDGNGVAWTGSRVAFGNTQDVRYQRTYAHELLHDFGLGHNNRTLDEVGWDVGARLVQNPAGNGETTRVKPFTDFDIMNAGRLTNEAWIDTTNYKYLLNHSTLAGYCGWRLRPFVEEVAVLRGVLQANGTMKIHPVLRYPWKSQPSEGREGRFVAELTDTNGVTTTSRFDTLVRADGEHGRDPDGAFSVMLPVDPNAEIASLRITNAERTVEYAEMQRSEPPRVKLVSPQPGTELAGRTEVEWAVDDPDTSEDQLLIEAAYSNDNGRSWVPIGVDIPGTDRGLTFDASELPESSGEGVIRVFVGDGLTTTYDDVAVR
jgi:hypothetical protein